MPNVNDVYRLSVVGSYNGEPIINTFYYRISVVGSGADTDSLNSGWVATPEVQFLAIMSQQYLEQFRVVQAVKPVGPAFTYNVTGITGGVAGNCFPSQAAVVMTRKTLLPGRGNRGRLFLGPIPISFGLGANNDQVNVATYAALATALAANVVNSGWTWVPVLWRRKANISVDLTFFRTNSVIKTRRSRALGQRFHRRRKRTVGSI